MSTSCSSAMERGPSSPSSSSRLEVLAPIDGLDIRILESNPPQYMLNVRAGLPSGCAERNRHETKRNAETLTVTVLNWMPAGSPPCTMTPFVIAADSIDHLRSYIEMLFGVGPRQANHLTGGDSK